MKPTDVIENIRDISTSFSEDRKERQLRQHLDQADFNRLREAGYLLTGVRKQRGGLWAGVQESTRPYCEILRVLAQGDPSVALVSSMHPAVLAFWLTNPNVEGGSQAAWDEQVEWLEETALHGDFWGTITSEPGSGGDIAKTKSQAKRDGDHYRLTGAKHFGSGSGMASYMITTALPDGESSPDLFFMDLRDAPWDGSTGITMLREWDGMGMAATQSHALRFESYPASRVAWPGHVSVLTSGAGPYIACSFTSVIIGIVDAAMKEATRQLAPRRKGLRSWEAVEWTRAEMDAWLIVQAYEGMLRAVERNEDAAQSALRGKTAAAELAERLMSRVCKVLGGGAFSRSSPFAHWYEDVRALGFLRPPWGLMFDQMYTGSSIHVDE